jgi:hypothetical protein
MPTSSVSKINVLPAGIGPIDLCPYPNSGGMVKVLFSPIHISSRPSSHLYVRQYANFIISPFSLIYTPLDDSPRTQLEVQRLPTIVRGIELASVRREGATVVHVDLVSPHCLPGTFDRVGDFDFETFWSGGDKVQKEGGEEGEEGWHVHRGGWDGGLRVWT